MEAQDIIRGEEKAAVVLISLGKKNAAEIIKHMSDEHIQKVTWQIAKNSKIPNEKRNEIINEFYEVCLAQGYISAGGIEYAKDVLNEALGTQRSIELISKMSGLMKAKPFGFLKNIDSNEVLNFLRYERNQTIALIMSYMDSEQSASVLSSLEPERQVDIVRRIAQMDKLSPDIVSQVEDEVKKKLDGYFTTAGYTDTIGIDIVASIMTSVDRNTEKTIFDRLEKENLEMADEIRKKMFVFEDIVGMDDRSLQTVLAKIEQSELALALKAVPENVKDKVLKNVSLRAKEVILEEMDIMGKVRLVDVQEKQQKIVSYVLEMERKGEIVTMKGKGEQFVE